MTAFEELKNQCYQWNLELPKRGLVLYTFGNLSVCDRDAGVMAIKPSGVPYEYLKPSDIVVLDFDGNVVGGDYRPSSDTNTHLVLYKQFPSIGSIVHTHSTYAVSWAQALRAIPIYGTTHADHCPGDIPCTLPMSDEAIARDYETETGNQIVNTLAGKSPEEYEMIIVGSHGPFSWGKTPQKAVYNSVVLEELAKMAYLTHSINPDVPRLKNSILNKHYERKHGTNAYYGQK
ncbi:MAG: L-ribulose-5-phosphate 4-epimerase AraD [Deltaproteobacteria bacterium]|nr:L-ribulose-5-phosphate 4-epimerase AraD [Deltaproteobacteria bacterium]